MKNLFLMFCFLLSATSVLFPQREYVRADNPVYSFLERMHERKLIHGYNSFEIPKTRNDIAAYLKEIDKNKFALNKTDRNILSDLFIEFEFDISGTLENSERLFVKGNYEVYSDDEKYLYYDADRKGNSLFINLLLEGENIIRSPKSVTDESSELGSFGGELRGTLINKFGYYFKATNGYAYGDKTAALLRNDLRYNFKFNEKPESRFFDNTEGYLTADFDAIRFKIGRDALRIGYSERSAFFSEAPQFNYLGINFNYSIINFSWFHGQIQGPKTTTFDTITGISTNVTEKYIGYHRLGFNFSDYFQLGIGEFIIYGDRPVDFGYLNPLAFYKSAEHSGNDRDNSMLFFDGSGVLCKGLKIHGTILLDDIDFGKIGKGWYGNQLSYNAGVSGSLFYYSLPLNFNAEYQHIEPYVFTHRILRNNFTNAGYSLYNNSLPNSEMISLDISHYFNYRTFAGISFGYMVHGSNPVLSDGSVINVGGDFNLGHRVFDSENVLFLSGYREYYRNFSAVIGYEPFNNLLLSYRLNYINNSKQLLVEKELQSFFLLSIKL